MARPELKWIFIQVTRFGVGNTDMYIHKTLYSYEECHKRKTENTFAWRLHGDPTFAEEVTYLCVPKRRVP